ncbi:unnamed protein product [Arabis nemorensis]|uniref:DUF4220 domain-containing protein n=1 Tax=Arabis nemorensis TaxID=586526 RepID=A0A565CFI8_9BRAS|nr:unnamed protein product [Arabis nemorensis]
MAYNNNLQTQKSGDTLEEKVDKILESLIELNKLLCPLKEDPLGRSKKEQGITESNNQKTTLQRSQSAPPALDLVSFYLITRLQSLKLKLGKLEQLHTNLGEELDKHVGIVHELIKNRDSSKDLFHEIRLVRSVHSEPLTRNLWSFVFSELQIKSQIPENLKNTKTKSSAKRGWASSHTQIQIADHEMLLHYITDVDYDHSLLIWHIATELCYQEEASTKEKCNTSEYHKDREHSKILSDYMMYLLIKQPKLMSEIAGIGKIRFRDTLAEAERFFDKMGIRSSRSVKLACEKILSVDTSIEPRDVKGTHSKSVLFEACMLAKELPRLEKDYGKDKWETLSKVWLELLFHVASHCDGTTRLELFSKGGELINFIWPLMGHVGMGD